MKTLLFLGALLAAMAWPSLAKAAEPGLLAHYNFDEGSGVILRDVSGHGHDGRIHGARYVPRGRGSCLEFDGVDDFVDCADPSGALDTRGAVTLEAWVCPAHRVSGEAGIAGKHFESYLLSYYADGQCWWYVSSGGNNAKSLLTPGAWHHVVGTFDGTALRLYLDGQLANASPSKFATAKPGKNFFLGCVLGDPNATDPNYSRSTFFPGQIDEVRVYGRALSEAEVKAHFASGVKDLALAADYQPVKRGLAIRRGGITARVGPRGQIELDSGQAAFVIESAFSYPGEQIGWNHLSAMEAGGEATWTPRTRKLTSEAVAIEAGGASYRLRRVVSLTPGRVLFEDTLTNLRTEPLGLIVRTRLTAQRPFRDSFTPGGAENPTLFVAGDHGGLGVLMEDDLSRLRFEPSLGLPANQARFQLGDLALDAGQSCTLRWTLYVLPKGAGYFDFVNRVRRDWGGNFTIAGPFAFFDVGEMRGLLEAPEKLRAYLTRKRLGVVGLSPWLDYDPGSFDRVWNRDEYKEQMQRAVRVLKAVQPDLRCVGCIETDWVTIDPARIPDGDKLPSHSTGSGLLNAEQTRILDAANLPWSDSVKRRADGHLTLELYSRGGRPQTALHVFPAIGNHQHRFLLEQVKFLLDEVGLDGFYIDEFNQAWRPDIRDYSRWDGQSAEVDPRTGRLTRRYTDCSLAGIGARLDLAQEALRRGKLVIANTYATARAEQALPVNRFAETQGAFDPFAAPDGVKPPLVPYLLRGALASPIGLGIVGASGKEDTARRLMKALVTYLRHGVLYYHYAIKDIPETGAGSGEYGPINHMFPITPVALHEGWIEGKERTITCVSGDYTWRGASRPIVRAFDLDGRERPPDVVVTQRGHTWRVRLRVRDWSEIAVVSEN
ncbi:MAG: LamG domain-containing protein [Verrucomicrobia bacterium]|nr:LamG domain-containing protein [Verrucomicrobiota bacterium]